MVETIYSGAGRLGNPDEELLSEIISRINERFGTDWTEAIIATRWGNAT